MTTSPIPADPHAFIARWLPSGGSERANYQMFLLELCDLLGVDSPDVTTAAGLGKYTFEREVKEEFANGKHTTRFIDFYRQGSFVLETKQGVEKKETAEDGQRQTKKAPKKKGHGVRGTDGYDTSMVKAKAQAEAYTRFLPAEEGRPPFVLVVDVGHSIEIYAEFTRTGGTYLPFPTPAKHRILLTDLEKPEVRGLLRTIWLDPLSLDPSAKAAKATREVAAKLAELGKSLEKTASEDGQRLYTAEQVSSFLMRMIFTMFAEDMNLFSSDPQQQQRPFRKALERLGGNPEMFVASMEELWGKMAKGGHSLFLQAKVLHFNGGLFENVEVLPITAEQLGLLIEAAKMDWGDVEPSIFGTLVERALNPVDRHRLGAHYTPRAYVERLVNKVVMEPLREDWQGVQVEIEAALRAVGDSTDPEVHRKARANAIDKVRGFLDVLRNTKVLDPACGTGNFLYVSMELMTQLEAEARHVLERLGGQSEILGVGPENFLGIEINERAAKVASLVLWIGYLQLYAHSHDKPVPPEPILREFKNIRNSDAVLLYTKTQVNLDTTRWDGVTRITTPDGREIPDPAARIPDVNYVSPTQAPWPFADFIVGNPPFIGAGPMRETLGDGYVKALRKTYKISKLHAGVPDSADFVMYWWFRAAQLLTLPRLRRFGFVTTNSIKQTFNRRVIEQSVDNKTMSLLYAVPDHPWVDEADGANVRIAMTVVGKGAGEGVLEWVTKETVGEYGEYEIETEAVKGRINSDLTVGVDITGAVELEAMEGISNRGVQLFGKGFIVPRTAEADPETKRKPPNAEDLGLGRIEGLEKYIREYRNGRDLNGNSRGAMVIDLFGLTERDVQDKFPEVYQHVKLTVKPERDQNNRETRRKNWWLFGETNPKLRDQLNGLPRYIATVETSKHRTFQFLEESILPDNKLIAIAHNDAYVLGVLSSRTHVAWAVAQGSTLEDRPVYVKTRCFETFPFPEATAEQQAAIREKAQALDDHRKRQLGLHPDLTLTELYNVLEKVRSGEKLSNKEQDIFERGLVETLKDLHDELDALVAAAYGWASNLSEQEILGRLTMLNTERAEEERQGKVQYLRREYQNPKATIQDVLVAASDVAASADNKKPKFPHKLAAQSQLIIRVLREASSPLTAGQVAATFRGVKPTRVEEVLEMLVALGQAREVAEMGGYAA